MRKLAGARNSGNTLTVIDSDSDVNLALTNQCLAHNLKIPPADSWGSAAVKRISDITVASGMILVSSPVMLLTALLVWLDDHGSVLQSAAKVGRHGKSFKVHKFRLSHLAKIDGASNQASRSQASVSKFREITQDSSFISWGLSRFDIENLPLMLSVLAGHMSIIGPRAKSYDEAIDLNPEQQLLQLVKPGLICLQEVRIQTDLSFAEWPDAELEYVMNRSLRLDMKILAHAWPTLLFCLKKK